MSEKPAESLEIGLVLAKRFRVLQKLGEGGFGAVYKVEDVTAKGTFYALKCEFHSEDVEKKLKLEVQIMQRLEKRRHVARCIWSGKRDTFSYMVMTLLGDSLDSIVRKHGPWLNVSTQVRIGICALFGIKQLHDIGYIHRDLKPGNIALGYKGTPDERHFLLLDFGMAREFVSDDANGHKLMRKPRERALFRGTSRYCSVAMHDRFEQGRVDDLWALAYLLAELRSELPWTEIDDKVKIGEMKRTMADEVLFKKSPTQMLEFVRVLRATTYFDRPDYERLFRMLDEVMRKADYKWTDPYHWELDRHASSITKSVVSILKPGTTKKVAENVAPFFTVDDFKTNPIGF